MLKTEESSKVGAGGTAVRARILIVDDSDDSRCICRDHLEPDYAVDEAHSGDEALRKIHAGLRSDLILLDIVMPGQDGYSVCEQLQAQSDTREIPIIFMTAINEMNTEVHGLSLGAVDYVTKPVSREILRARVRNHLSLARTRLALQQANEILEIKVAERTQQLSAALIKANAAQEVKRQFLANVSHELRTPMNGIIGLGALLMMEALTEEQRDMLDAMNASARSMMAILNQIIDYAAVDSGSIEMTSKPYRLGEVIMQIKTLFDARAHQAGIAFACHVDPKVPDELIGDPMMLHQILMPLLDNAFKFTSAGSVTLLIDHGNDAILRFCVEDSGCGIPAEKIDDILQPFRQADNSSTRRYGGLGLGLSLVKRRVELLGGALAICKREPVGTRVCLELPQGYDDKGIVGSPMS